MYRNLLIGNNTKYDHHPILCSIKKKKKGTQTVLIWT